MYHNEIPERCKLNFTGIVDDALRIADLNCLQENRLKVNSEREQDSPVEMGASNISRFKEMPFLKAKRHRAHSVVSGVRVKAPSSSINPTPLAHAYNQGDVHPKGVTSQLSF
ncbi:hypothetical protein TNCV_62221 [Trichonephila clavipes]|nr:hypothetical protein TNCV_62221 [Trichonephila clavipes]